MRRRPVSPFWIHDVQQVNAIASPVRAAVIDALEVLGPATIGQVATALGYPPDGLYYHFAVLERNGLVIRIDAERGHACRAIRSAGTSGHAALPPRRPPAATRHCQGRRDDGPGRRPELRSCLAPGLATAHGPRRNLRAGRRTAWLTARELQVLNRYIERIHALFGRGLPRRTGARLHEFTYVLAPMVEQGRRARTRPQGARS